MHAHRVALVTGGGSGIGRAAAHAFAEHGCTIVVMDQNDAAGEETVQQILGKGHQACFIKADVRHEDQVASAMQAVEQQYGRLDYALNNAGIAGERAVLHEYPTDTFDDVMAVNVRGVWLCMKHQLPLMLKHPELDAAIVVTSSTAGLRSFPEFSPYCASKHALMGIVKSAAAEYAGRVRINCVCPATIDTPMVAWFAQRWPDFQASMNSAYPMGRIGTAAEVAEAMLWLATKATWSTGQYVAMDGGSMAA